MALNVFPVDAATGAPSYTGRIARQTLGALAAGARAGRPLGAYSGVVAGTPQTTVTATSTACTIAPHKGVLDVEANAISGPYMYSIDQNVTRTVPAADATNPRIDSVVVQLSDPAEGDGTSTPGIDVIYTAGTPAASPSLPTQPPRSLILAAINVPKSGGGSPTVTFAAPFAVATGGITPTYNSGYRPAGPYLGQYCDDPVAGLMRYNGSAWVQYTPIAEAFKSITMFPGSTLNTPASGTATWFNLGSIIVPGWATQAICTVNINSQCSSASSLNVNIKLKIGSVSGTSLRVNGSTDTGVRTTGWTDTLTGLTTGSQTASISATFNTGTGTFQVTTATIETLSVTFLP